MGGTFVEWTRDGLLRHPELVGVRNDKSPREVMAGERLTGPGRSTIGDRFEHLRR
jgi:hypothetical protein